MKRYFPILLLLFVVGAFLYYGESVEERMAAEKKAEPIKAELRIYSDLPQNITTLLAKAYEKKYHVRLTLLPLTEEQLIEKVRVPYGQGAKYDVDMILTYQDTLALAARQGYLLSYVSENTDLVADQFKNMDGLWVGLWYDPQVFVMNNQFFAGEGKKILTWQDLMTPERKGIIITDFVASRSAANMLYQFVEAYGEAQALQKFINLKPHILQYAKFLNTPARLAAMGSVDLGIANYSDGGQLVAAKYPVKLVFPQDGVPYNLVGVAILKGTAQKEETQELMHWLMSDEAKWQLDQANIFFQYTNPAFPKLLDSLSKEANLLEIKGGYTEEGKKILLNKWIEQVRFRKDSE